MNYEKDILYSLRGKTLSWKNGTVAGIIITFSLGWKNYFL